jgi:BirA family transcriptional regulator, biotin operon repressor / biotin---[acetyl-CoA-carboxylase] ligase
MGFALGSAAAEAGHRLFVFDSIDSTNSEALRRAAAGESGPAWLVAERQTAGHGRRGRAWASPEGNLAATHLFTPRCAPEQAASLGFVAGLSLDRALRSLAPGHATDFALDGTGGHASATTSVRGVRLKWPNDLVAESGKLAGILVEAVPRDGSVQVAIGFGVNVAAAPAELPYPAASLADLGVRTSAEAVFAALTQSWVELVALWDEGRSFGAIRKLWLARAAGLGAPMSVRVGTSTVSGIFETLDEWGRLVVRTADGGTTQISAGEVHFGTAATAQAG